MARIDVTLQDLGAQAVLDQILAVGLSPRPLLLGMGEILVASTKARFASSTGPDGQRWAPNAPSTYLSYLGVYSGSFGKKTGKITAKGSARAIAKRPLIGETRQLGTTINYHVEGDALLVGSPMIYASPQQFGAEKGEFGKTKRGAPIPWGDIPARPFLGLSAADREAVLDLADAYLTGGAT